MRKRIGIVLIGVGVSVGLMGGVASAQPEFNGQCVGDGVSEFAKANAAFGSPVADFVRELMSGDCVP